MNNSITNDRINSFFNSSSKRFKHIPLVSQVGDRVTRSTSLGIFAGLIDYLTQQALGIDKFGYKDDLSIILAIMAGMFLGSIRDARFLCQNDKQLKLSHQWNFLKALSAGGVGGGAFAAIQQIVDFISNLGLTPLESVIALILTSSISTGGISLIYQQLSRQKKCTHIECSKKGKCHQRVCRSCKRLFYPSDISLDCNKNLFLDWFMIASYLDGQKLNYLDAEVFVRDNFKRWKIFSSSSGDYLIDCNSFATWINNNKGKLASYIGSGSKNRSETEIIEYLDSNGL
jgi:hypothetical protein